ncbi:response regulator transcription factor [Sphingobacterium paramultivorum]|uniref:Response regulator transcription factor n=1 Tax=Sphingobacterium paramultivorum TaxID=2886510 RepID=A0A7G5E1V7_9SPHI|nr:MULTISPECIES: response regulator transcription factor [Sphingobacterium]MCS4167918.1 DNA-binding NarL/FixJ family response regulator [Sphingobacterium sp. BIGb0116]QMV67982.1 response regulator transcription factor [Sphingobacterium paramultivorum]WSO16882.1 response regulator transcription factor [Sphingobacterium paramultivorum]
MYKILLVDDHTLVRNGFRLILESHKQLSIVGEVGNGVEALEFLGKGETPDLIITDLKMEEMSGITLIHKVKAKYPEIDVAVLSMIEDNNTVADAFRAGAVGFLSKNSDYDELVQGIFNILQGKRYISMEIGLSLLDHFQLNRPIYIDKEAIYHRYDISERELMVLELISRGFTNAEIADQIFLSKRTVEGHRQQLIDKTKTKNTADLVRFAFQNKLLQ